MKFVDVHAHMTDKSFDLDRESVIEQAIKAGAVHIITNATNYEDGMLSLALAQKHPSVRVALGIYPDETLKLSETEFSTQLKWIATQKNSIIAIGEIGLDYKWTKEEEKREIQKKRFIQQLHLAKKMKKPVIIHSRNAEREVVDILIQEEMPRVVMHCFCGRHSIVKDAIKHKFHFSIPPKVVNDSQFEELVKIIPIDRLLTETDSPYLHYERGERNEPKYIRETIKKIAEIKKMDENEVANILFFNYKKLFS